MNLTLSIDEALAARARAVAAGRGKSLDQLVRDLLEAETGIHDGAAPARVLDERWATSPVIPGARASGARMPTTVGSSERLLRHEHPALRGRFRRGRQDRDRPPAPPRLELQLPRVDVELLEHLGGYHSGRRSSSGGDQPADRGGVPPNARPTPTRGYLDDLELAERRGLALGLVEQTDRVDVSLVVLRGASEPFPTPLGTLGAFHPCDPWPRDGDYRPAPALRIVGV